MRSNAYTVRTSGESSALLNTAAFARDEMDPAQLARDVVDCVRERLSAQAVALYWCDEELPVLRLLSSSAATAYPCKSLLHRGESITASAFARRTRIVISPPDSMRQLKDADGRSETKISVALRVDDAPVGLLTITIVGAFRSSDAPWLARLARAVEHAAPSLRGYAETQRWHIEAQMLSQLLRASVAEFDPDATLSRVSQCATSLLGADVAAIAVSKSDRAVTWRGLVGDRSDLWQAADLLPDENVADQAPNANAQETIVLTTSSRETRTADDAPISRREGIGTVLSAPLIAHGRRLGSLLLGWRDGVEIAKDEVHMAETIAAYAATIIADLHAGDGVSGPMDHEGAYVMRASPTPSSRLLRSRTRLAGAVSAVSEEHRIAPEPRHAQQHRQAVQNSLVCGIITFDRFGKVQTVNDPARAMLGISTRDLHGRRADSLGRRLLRPNGSTLSWDEHPAWVALCTLQPQRSVLLGVEDREGRCRWIQGDAVPIVGAGREIEQIVYSFIDVTQRQRSLERQALQRSVTRVLATYSRQTDAIPKIIGAIRDHLGWEIGAWWSRDRHMEVLRCHYIAATPALSGRALVNLSRLLPLHRGSDLPGLAWAHTAPVWLENLRSDSSCIRAMAAAKDGLRIGVAIPIHSGPDVDGVMEFLCRRPERRDEELLDALTASAAQIAQFIERAHLDTALLESETRLKSVLRNTPIIVFELDPAGIFTMAEGHLLAAVGFMPGEVLGRSAFDLCGDAPAFNDAIRRGLAGESFTGQVALAGRSFQMVWSPIFDEVGAFKGTSAVATDVTELRRAKKTRRVGATRPRTETTQSRQWR